MMAIHPFLILLGFALLLAGVLLAGVQVVRALAARAARHHGPVCGQCGYSTHGLTTLICPECGSDLRVVGISVNGRKPAGLDRLLVWGLAIAAGLGLGVIQWTIVGEHLPREVRRSEQRTLTGPASRGYQQIIMDAGGAGWAHQPSRLNVKLTITLSNGRAGTPLDLRVDQTVREQKTGVPFSTELLKSWLENNGVTMEEMDPELGDIAMAVLQATSPREYDTYSSYSATGSRRDGSFTMESYAIRITVTQPSALTLPVQVIWAVAYAAGVFWILRGRTTNVVTSQPAACGSHTA